MRLGRENSALRFGSRGRKCRRIGPVGCDLGPFGAHSLRGRPGLCGRPGGGEQIRQFPGSEGKPELRTEEGRAEVLLTPGVFLRLGENSSFRMITNRLIDTRLEFLSGLGHRGGGRYRQGQLRHGGLSGCHHSRFEEGHLPVRFRARRVARFRRLAEVTSGEQTVEVKEGHLIALDTLAVQVRQDGDRCPEPLERAARRILFPWRTWAAGEQRAIVRCSGGGMFNGGWYFNPFFGMYSFVPGMGMGYSPYGYPCWSPFNLYRPTCPLGYSPRPATTDSTVTPDITATPVTVATAACITPSTTGACQYRSRRVVRVAIITTRSSGEHNGFAADPQTSASSTLSSVQLSFLWSIALEPLVAAWAVLVERAAATTRL